MDRPTIHNEEIYFQQNFASFELIYYLKTIPYVEDLFSLFFCVLYTNKSMFFLCWPR